MNVYMRPETPVLRRNGVRVSRRERRYFFFAYSRWAVDRVGAKTETRREFGRLLASPTTGYWSNPPRRGGLPSGQASYLAAIRAAWMPLKTAANFIARYTKYQDAARDRRSDAVSKKGRSSKKTGRRYPGNALFVSFADQDSGERLDSPIDTHQRRL